MKKDTFLDYNSYFESILTLEKEPQEIKATQFLHFLSDLVLKYKTNIETSYLHKRGDS